MSQVSLVSICLNHILWFLKNFSDVDGKKIKWIKRADQRKGMLAVKGQKKDLPTLVDEKHKAPPKS